MTRPRKPTLLLSSLLLATVALAGCLPSSTSAEPAKKITTVKPTTTTTTSTTAKPTTTTTAAPTTTTTVAPAPPPPAGAAWSDSNPPWLLRAGESLDDNRPAGVAVVSYSDYSSGGTRSFTQTLDAIRAAATTPYYVRMPAGTFHISSFSYGSGTNGYGAGYQDVNKTKLFGGLIGAGADKTFIVVDPNSMSSSQLSAVAAGNPSPVQIKAIYAGSSASTIPTFFSGITLRGNFQQTTTLSGMSGTAPAPYEGLFLTATKPGSVIQYTRFQGFGFTAKSSPPYETGAINSTHSDYTVRRVEIDGRLAKEINADRPVASGGFMGNYEKQIRIVDSWLHHTRRSGWATHDHAVSEGGNASDTGAYYAENFQVEAVANTTDSFAGSSLGFASSNVEEVRNSMTYVRPRFTATTPAHIVIGTTNGNAMAKSISVADPVISDTTRGGCLIIRIIKQPNSYGINPYYSAYQSGGFAALPIRVTKGGSPLTPVLSTAYNPSIHTPQTHYVVIMG